MENNILEDNEKLVTKFGAKRAKDLEDIPEFYTFKKGLIYSHRDFDKFYSRLKKGEPSAIVSGVNASGTLHLGHKVIFDTNLFFQKEFNIPVYIPISDDESYVAGKVKTQEEGKEYAIKLAKEMLAYGFDPEKTYFIIDNIYTNIYNLAFKLSTKVNYSEIKAAYGYKPEENIGLHFYPTVQAAHVLFPNEHSNIKNILVPIGPDEDAHLRISRDIATRAGYDKPAVLHLTFMPGLDGEKASKSKKNAVHFNDDEKTLKKACNKALSGGQETIDEHRKLGGDPEKDISCQYLKNYFYDEKQSNKLFLNYMNGQLLSGEVKNLLFEELKKLTGNFQTQVKNIKDKDLDKSVLKNC